MRLTFGLLFIIACFTGCDDGSEDAEVTACFSYTIGECLTEPVAVFFQNCSDNADSYVWDFGDSTQSIEENPTHSYAEHGAYYVTLEASNSTGTDICSDTVYTDMVIDRKPNIYLYPVVDMDIAVTLGFPLGGSVIESIPEYGNGWNVHVSTTGIINDTYEFLFYEAINPDVWQMKQGWCIAQDDLEGFFQTNMQTWNFNQNEINDFIEYWIPRLTEFDYYVIYPQEKHLIEQVIEMDIVPAPDNLNRLFYLIAGSDEIQTIKIPTMTAFGRDGFTVVEWGVVLK